MPEDLGAPPHIMAMARALARSGEYSSADDIVAQLRTVDVISSASRALFSLPERLELERIIRAARSA